MAGDRAGTRNGRLYRSHDSGEGVALLSELDLD